MFLQINWGRNLVYQTIDRPVKLAVSHNIKYYIKYTIGLNTHLTLYDGWG